jgi:hypothetical protein
VVVLLLAVAAGEEETVDAEIAAPKQGALAAIPEPSAVETHIGGDSEVEDDDAPKNEEASDQLSPSIEERKQNHLASQSNENDASEIQSSKLDSESPLSTAADGSHEDAAQVPEEQKEDVEPEFVESTAVPDSNHIDTLQIHEKEFASEVPRPTLLKESAETPDMEQHVPQGRMVMSVDVHVPGVPQDDVRVEHFSANSEQGRRLLKARVGTWPNTGLQSQGSSQNYGHDSTTSQIPEMAHTYNNDVTAVTIKIPHDGDPTTNTQIISLHGRATDPDSFTATPGNGMNDPYTPHFHDPYSGSSGTTTDAGPQQEVARYESNLVDGTNAYLSGSQTVFSTGTGQNDGPSTVSFFDAWNKECTNCYHTGDTNANACSQGRRVEIEADCAGAAAAIKATFKGTSSESAQPRGCRTNAAKTEVWFNTHSTGAADAGSAPVCKKFNQFVGGQTTPRGSHDPLKLSWACNVNGQKSPEVAHETSLGHAQGYRKSTGQRTQGNEPFYDDERTSCSQTPDVSGFKPSCLVHSYDQPPALTWGSHALQDGPDITLTVPGPTTDWTAGAGSGSANVVHTCTLTAKDPYGATNTMQVQITVEKEDNGSPVASWRSGGVTTYTVPHDHSPLTNEVQVLLDGEYSDPDNSNNNIGPLGNTAIETTAAAQRRGFSVQEQLNWQGLDACDEKSCAKDGTSWALFRGRPGNTAATGSRFGGGRPNSAGPAYDTGKYSTVFHPYDNMEKHGNDKVTFRWTCNTCTGGPCVYHILKPTVTLPGPAWTLNAAGTWQDPGGQVGQTSQGSQWAATHIDHTCVLRVTDSYGKHHEHSQVIRVNREPNTIPVANAGAAQTYTVPHDFYPSAETNTVLVTLTGIVTADADNDKMKHKWVCVCTSSNGDCVQNQQYAWATVELPFPAQLGGVATGFTYNSAGGIETGGADPQYVASTSSIQTTSGWGADSGHSGDGDLFLGTHTHDRNEVKVTLPKGVHRCTLTTTDTYNEAHSHHVDITINAEPNSNPNAAGG